MSAAGRRLLDGLYPPRCRACGRPDREPLCAACRAGLCWLGEPRCERCGLPFDPLHAPAAVCRGCRARRRPALRAARAAVAYAGPARQLIRRLKFHRRHGALDGFEWLLARWLEQSAAADDAGLAAADGLVPVPLHRWRRWWRGFNQADLLAGVLARLTGLPVWPALLRIRATRPQVGLNPAARRRNVAGAFASNPKEACTGASLVLVDDLFTTGATLDECARTLCAAGAARVTAVTVAQRLEPELVAALMKEPGWMGEDQAR